MGFSQVTERRFSTTHGMFLRRFEAAAESDVTVYGSGSFLEFYCALASHGVVQIGYDGFWQRRFSSIAILG